MSSQRVLVVDDEKDILDFVHSNLTKDGFKVSCASTGEMALKLAQVVYPDCFVLDIMLPGIDGYALCKQLKKDSRFQETPVILLSARGEDADIVAGLEVGAVDYVTKPFSPKVLAARVRAALRQSNGTHELDQNNIMIHGIEIQLKQHTVKVQDEPVKLTNTEFQILLLMAKHPGWVYTREQIVEAIRGPGYVVTERSIDVHISGLRMKLNSHGDCIETVHGVGYRIRESD